MFHILDILSCPNEIENGNINNASVRDRYSFQSEVLVDCNDGYTADDRESMTMCHRNCKWNTTDTICEGKHQTTIQCYGI